MLHKELQENDITLVWLGFSGSDHNYLFLDKTILTDEIIEYDTTNIVGYSSRCGTTDFASDRQDYLAVYCFTPKNFVCHLLLTDNIATPSSASVTCDQGWNLFHETCYKIETSQLSYTDAQTACQKQSATLATITSQIDQSFFSTSPFLASGTESYWIGVKYDISSQSYLLDNSDKKPQILNWDPNQMYNSTTAPCVYVNAGSTATFMGSWTREKCDSLHKFVCQKAGNPIVPSAVTSSVMWSDQCGVGWTYSNFTNMCYYISAYAHKPWREARSLCQSHKGELLSISGYEEQKYIESILSSNDYKNLQQPLWIGAADMWEKHGWGWSDKKPFRYIHWGEGQPHYDSTGGDNCGYMPVARRFEWEARPCSDRLGYICKKAAFANENTEFPKTPSTSSCVSQELISGFHSIQFPSGFSASSYKDDQHRPEDCRMGTSNTRAWVPANDSTNEWLQISFHSPVTITDINLGGEDSTDKYVSKFKMEYQYDASSDWYWVSDSNRNPKIFDGVTTPDSTQSIFLMGDIQAQSVKIWPVEWSYGIAIQIELMGCAEDLCEPEYAMSGPLIVSDQQITSSSAKLGHEAWNARLRPVQENKYPQYWIPEDQDLNPWIQVDLGKDRIVRGVSILKNSAVNNYVTKFSLMFSQDGAINDFVNYTEPYSQPRIFDGVTANSPMVTVYLGSSVLARVVRLVVVEKNLVAALKFDVLVCSTGCRAEPMIANKPNVMMTSSSDQMFHTTDRSILNTPKEGDQSDGWKPIEATQADSSYIMLDLGFIAQITAVATQGSQSDGSWVKSYFLSFSNGSSTYSSYQGNTTYHTSKYTVPSQSNLYQGNFDGSTVLKNELSPPVAARYVQLWPHEFQRSIALRWEVYACPQPTMSPLGCYADEIADPDLPFTPQLDKFANIFPDSCVSLCFQKGFSYAGLENSTLCSCGNDYGMYGPSNDCSTLCLDPYSDKVCGGDKANLIYSTGLSASSLVCPNGWRPYRDSCYMLVGQPKTWSDASSTCAKLSSDLADVVDRQENIFISSLLTDNVTKAWIGLNDLKLQLTFDWSSQKEVLFTNWGAHQPQTDPGLDAHSVTIDQDGRWATTYSESYIPFICKMKKKASDAPVNVRQDTGCLQGWIGFDDKCFRLNRLKNSWTSAKSLCELEGATLLHISSEKENSFVTSFLLRSDGYFWIDILDSNSTGFYQHFYGTSQILFTNWAAQKPDSSGSCVSIGTGANGGMWYNSDCQTRNSYICQLPRNVTATPNTSPTPTTGATTSCSDGWQTYGDSLCYQVNAGDATSYLAWHEAEEDCRSKGANLASFHSDSVFKNLISKFSSPSSGNFWIGLNNLDLSTGYEWTDGSVVNFIKWGTGQPRSDIVGYVCGELLTTASALGLQSCQQLKGWICSIEKGKATVVIPPVVYPPPDTDDGCRSLTGTWLKYKNYCYHISDGQGGADGSLTWRESRQWCGRYGADLVSINSEDENRFLQGVFKYGVISESIWIGLNELDRNSGYSWTDRSPVNLFNWNVNEPNDENGYEACTEILVRNGKWNDQHCSRRQGFICKQPVPGTNVTHATNVSRPNGNCPPNFSKFGQKCYRVLGVPNAGNPQTWADARKSCSKLVVDKVANYTVDLASATSIMENAFITTLLASYGQPAWVGLRRLSAGQFLWSDNEDLTYVNWNKGKPDMPTSTDSCVSIDNSLMNAGKWNDLPCDQPLAYVCQGFTDPSIPPPSIAPSAKCDTLHGYQRHGKSCLKAINQTLSWQDARSRCKNDGGNLISILDCYDWAETLLIIQGFADGAWIGLNDLKKNGTYEWDSGYPLTYTRWAHHQPLDHQNWGCVYINNRGLFNNGPCSDQRSSVCRIDDEPPQTPSAPAGGDCTNPDFHLLGSSCYLLVTSPTLTYDEAANDCRTRGATLASLHDSSLNLMLSADQNVWIGLRESINEGFSWEDGTVLAFTAWGDNQPRWGGADEAEVGCVTTSSQGTWSSRDCQDKYGYLCSMPRESLTTQPPASSVSYNSQVTLTSSTTTVSPSTITYPHIASTTITISSSSISQTSPTSTTPQPGVSSTTPTNTSLPGASSSDSGGLSGGETAGVVIGVLLAVVLVAAVLFFVVKKHGCVQSSFLRQEASKTKNFENSLYEATHKDTLTKIPVDHNEMINIVGLESRDHQFSVSYTPKEHLQNVPYEDFTSEPDAAYMGFDNDCSA
ncbi:macrophage mannose receptor 1-like [Physella acuta]|uniref:macrophage mannose receptor 1-like n=1 Tax=Physella acuta TaxID=109671 RepID=UPI0027DB595B|nr:macrophage mannose receptor 1-like [Physella acuta]